MPEISLETLRKCLLDISQPIAQRTHAAFVLRTRGDSDSVEILAEALKNKADSSLMRHELAYILGQIGNAKAVPLLTALLDDEDDDLLVRHESAEALGAIGLQESLPVLVKYASHPAREIAETCQIAIDLIAWNSRQDSGQNIEQSFATMDPAPAFPNHVFTIEELKHKLLSPHSGLFERYRAMFTLRNRNTDEAALALVEGFSDNSALFRHEIAYVLGQMQRRVTVAGLTAVLQNESEHRMVRHEAAEALGAIGGADVESILQGYLFDNEQVVKESCQVALDTIEYWAEGNFDQL